jgi:hypothetical protein
MPGELVPRRHQTPAQRAVAAVNVSQARAQALVQAQAELTDYAMYSVAMLKRNQQMLEEMVPDASEMLNLISTGAAMSIARRVAGFGNDQ